MAGRHGRSCAVLALLFVSLTVGACSKKQPPVARPTPPPPSAAPEEGAPPKPPEPVAEPEPVVPEEPGLSDTDVDLNKKSLDEINKESPLQAVFFNLDSAEVDSDGQTALQQNSQILEQYDNWVVTIEGHCDERGTAEYNLALGERRALAARNYLVSLGIPADRVKTVSYGKEFPFDPGHTEEAWAKNRRGHFVVTGK